MRDVDAVVVPGGFAHGDYLRTGAIARFSPVMDAVAEHAAAGGPVVGICNGFQVLTEAGLLPGALQKNAGLTFVCDTGRARGGEHPLGAHPPGRGRRAAAHPDQPLRGQLRVRSPTRWRALHDDDRIVVRYVDNPNGSLDDIAGISNEAGNVVGLMPHPERRQRRPPRQRRRRRPAASRCSPACSGVTRVRGAHEPLEIPAFLSTSAGTPSSRHAA